MTEGAAFPVEDNDSAPLRTFELSLRGVTVEVCSLGASLTKWMVPCPSKDDDDNQQKYDDIVLGYKSPNEMFQTGNPSYLSVVVGRVANRIEKGLLRLKTIGNDGHDEEEFQLAINNEPNHLHGGVKGFSRRIWNAETIQTTSIDGKSTSAVKFSLTSDNGDQGYPGTIQCSAIYSLTPQGGGGGVSLNLELSATLVEGDDNNACTPINLAQHSYFNLSRHNDPRGVLDHKLVMPSQFYTPVDKTGIPTRQVKSLNDDTVMDWREGRLLEDAITEFATAKAGLDANIAQDVVSDRSLDLKKLGLEPFGFDHNFVVVNNSQHSNQKEEKESDRLCHVGTLTHEATKRSLRIKSSAPGVQLYTANYLNALDPTPSQSKDGASYLRWQGVCLETQHFPDSINVNKDTHPEFAKGQCVILGPENSSYTHQVVYELDFEKPAAVITKGNNAPTVFRGNDSDGNAYDSVDVMWQTEGVSESNKAEWYDRASQYYEDNCPETIDGVLGGFANITDLDLEGSRDFVKEIQQIRGGGWSWSLGAAAECGAGIGRVSKGLLLGLNVKSCDLVESSSRLLAAAPDYIGPESSRCRFYCQGLQSWMPAKYKYSIIWIQWVFCYLTDTDAVSFLRRCGEALVEGGVICLKENSCSDTDFVLDREDASVTRSVPYLLHLAKEAGLTVVLQRFQTNVRKVCCGMTYILLLSMNLTTNTCFLPKVSDRNFPGPNDRVGAWDNIC